MYSLHRASTGENYLSVVGTCLRHNGQGLFEVSDRSAERMIQNPSDSCATLQLPPALAGHHPFCGPDGAPRKSRHTGEERQRQSRAEEGTRVIKISSVRNRSRTAPGGTGENRKCQKRRMTAFFWQSLNEWVNCQQTQSCDTHEVDGTGRAALVKGDLNSVCLEILPPSRQKSVMLSSYFFALRVYTSTFACLQNQMNFLACGRTQFGNAVTCICLVSLLLLMCFFTCFFTQATHRVFHRCATATVSCVLSMVALVRVPGGTAAMVIVSAFGVLVVVGGARLTCCSLSWVHTRWWFSHVPDPIIYAPWSALFGKGKSCGRRSQDTQLHFLLSCFVQYETRANFRFGPVTWSRKNEYEGAPSNL